MISFAAKNAFVSVYYGNGAGGFVPAVADGSPTYHIVLGLPTTTDTTGYAALNPPDVTVTNTDDDTAGYTVSMISQATTEGMGTATFTVRLNSEPTADVVIGRVSPLRLIR